MGCAQSRIDNEESVSRCKERKILMKEALTARNAFAAAHSAYSMALKNTGVALSGYAQGEAEIPDPTGVALPTISQPPHEPLPPPPPPLPSFSPSPLQRSVTMPELPVSKRGISKMGSISIPEDEEVLENGNVDGRDHGGNHDGGRNLRRKKREKSRDGVVVNDEREMARPSPSPPLTPPLNAVAPPPPPPGLKGMAWDYFFMVENMPGSGLSENEEIEDDEKDENGGGGGYGGIGNASDGVGELGRDVDGAEFKTPEKGTAEGGGKVVLEGVEEEEEVVDMETPPVVKQFVHSNTAPPELRRASKVGNSVSMLKVLKEIDDHFLKASECSQEVNKMLEANRFQYHYNFADHREPVDHAARVMRVITWNRSLSGMPGSDGGKNDYYTEDNETHAIVLDKLLAWEKKLYDEVKAGELMKLEYQRKVALLNRQKKRSAPAESLEKTKAAVSHLHTRYIVDMQSMDSTVSEVNDLRDRQLYPKLVELVNGMANMWEKLCLHHDGQLQIVTDLKSLNISVALRETSEDHHKQTNQLFNVVQEWHDQFEKLVTHQKHYIRALNSWLKLNLIPIESSLKEKISSPPRAQAPPIQPLLHSWHDCLEKLPDELAKSAISSFAAVIKTIILHQEEERKLKEKCEETRKEYLKKSQAFEEWYHKHEKRRARPEEMDPDRGEETSTNSKDPVSERQFVVESLKKRLEEEIEAHQRQCVQVREKSLGSLRIRLPELFRAMSDYSHACADAYNRLRSIAQAKSSNGGPSS